MVVLLGFLWGAVLICCVLANLCRVSVLPTCSQMIFLENRQQEVAEWYVVVLSLFCDIHFLGSLQLICYSAPL